MDREGSKPPNPSAQSPHPKNRRLAVDGSFFASSTAVRPSLAMAFPDETMALRQNLARL